MTSPVSGGTQWPAWVIVSGVANGARTERLVLQDAGGWLYVRWTSAAVCIPLGFVPYPPSQATSMTSSPANAAVAVPA